MGAQQLTACTDTSLGATRILLFADLSPSPLVEKGLVLRVDYFFRVRSEIEPCREDRFVLERSADVAGNFRLLELDGEAG